MSFGKTALTAALLIGTLATANAVGLGREGVGFGKLGLFQKQGVAVPQPNGDILMVDGTSLILQTDGASFVCRAGGC